MRAVLLILPLLLSCEPLREPVYHGGRVNLLNLKPVDWESHPVANGATVRVYNSAGVQTDETETHDGWFNTEVLSYDHYAVVLEQPGDPEWLVTATSGWSYGDENEAGDYGFVTTVLEPDYPVEPFRDCLDQTERAIVGTGRLYDPTGDRPPGVDDDWENGDFLSWSALELPPHDVRVVAVDGAAPAGPVCERGPAFQVAGVEPGWRTLTLASKATGASIDVRVYVPEGGIGLLRAATFSTRPPR